ncbi:MAG: aldo/keto reductase [bacterium]|nr:aldo/keto reductase [bacterium]
MKNATEITIEGVRKKVSSLALGTAFYQLKAKDTCFNILDSFAEAGGTLIDTARDYGESEQVIGLWLEARKDRGQIVLITKGGQGKYYGLSPEDFAPTLERELTASLERLRTDSVDLYLLHRDSPMVAAGDIIEYLNKELARGRIRAAGVSNWEYHRIAEANEYARAHGLKGIAAVSNNLSLAVPTGPFYPGLVSVDQSGEKWHERTRIPLIVWSAQARGFFTGRYSMQLNDPNQRDRDPFAARMIEIYSTDDNLERLRRATEMGKNKGGYTATQIALAWLLHKPFPLAPIVGARDERELASCIQATEIKLTDAEAQWLNLEV